MGTTERPPGAPSWMHYVLPLVFPSGIGIATLIDHLTTGLSDVAFGAITIFLPLLGMVIWGVLDGRRRRKEQGLVPQQAGYSAEVDLLSQKLRERAAALDSALRFDRPIEEARELQSFADDVLRVANQTDGQNLLPGFRVRHGDEIYLGQGPLPKHAPEELGAHADALRSAAKQLETYAREVRQRGGVYRFSQRDLLGCGTILLVMFGVGAWMILRAIRSDGSMTFAIGLILLTVLLAYSLLVMLRERP